MTQGRDEMKDQIQQDVLEKYDRESGFRKNLGPFAWFVTIIGIGLTVFHLWRGWVGAYPSQIQGAVHVGVALCLVFLLYPVKKGWQHHQRGVPWYDFILASLGLWVGVYNIVNYEVLISSRVITGYTTLDLIIASIGVLLVLEAARRCVGLPIVMVCLVAISYTLFGNHIPSKLFAHTGFSWSQFASDQFLTTKGIFGTPIQVSSSFIFLFLFFGVMLVKTKVGQFFNDMAFALTGKYTGGQSKAAVTASGLQGMISGSSVANTVGSGSFTIPMMKKAGYKPEFASAVEASASTGGQIMPPIMGAAAFIMATYTQTPYSDIILAAAIPALLYFTGVFLGTHFESKKLGILGSPKNELPSLKHLMLTRGYLLLPIAIIFYKLFSGSTPTRAALWAIFITFVISLIRKETRLSVRGVIHALEEGARAALPVIVACAAAGIIVGVVVQTGLGARIASGIITLGAGHLILTLFLTMIACIILGMGLPTTANYVVTATMAAPALVLGMDIPVLAAHMFVFYFGIVADITPPVCLAAYAGAGLARANPFQSGVTAVKLAVAAYIIPYIFVMNPQMLFIDAKPVSLILSVTTALIGMFAISSGAIGYLIRTSRVWERIMVFGAGLALVYPASYLAIVGMVVIGIILFVQSLRPQEHVTPGKGVNTA